MPNRNLPARRLMPCLLAVVLAWSMAACTAPAASTSVASASEVVNLAGVDQLADMFNETDADTPKLVLLLSPS